MIDLGILWVGPEYEAPNGRRCLFTYRCDCTNQQHGQHVAALDLITVKFPKKPDETYWWMVPAEPDKGRVGVWAGAGRFWVERTRAEGVSMRWGMVPVQMAPDAPRAHATVQYSMTIKTGDTEDVAGGAVFLKTQVGVTMPCAPAEVADMVADLQGWLGTVLAEERKDIVAAYGIEPTVTLEEAIAH